MVMIKKFLIIFGILMLFLPVPTISAASVPRFELSPANQRVNLNCSSRLQVLIDTGKRVSNAADIILKYDPAKIEILDADPLQAGIQIMPGKAYDVYVGNQVDETTGTIKLTAFNANLSERALFAEVPFKAKVSSGQTNVGFLFFGHNYLNTKDSNIAEIGTSNDILQEVKNATIEFGDGSCERDVVPPEVIFAYPLNLQTNIDNQNLVQFYISDIGMGVDINTLSVTIDGITYTTKSPELKFSGDSQSYKISIEHIYLFRGNEQSNVTVTVKDFAQNTGAGSVIFNIHTELPRKDNVCIAPRSFFEQFLFGFLKDGNVFINALGPMSLIFLLSTLLGVSGYWLYQTFLYSMFSSGLWQNNGRPVIQIMNSSQNLPLSGIRVVLVSAQGKVLERLVSNNYGVIYSDVEQPFLVRLDSKDYVMLESNTIHPENHTPSRLRLVEVKSKFLALRYICLYAITILSFVFSVANLIVFFARANEPAFIIALLSGTIFTYSLSKIPLTFFVRFNKAALKS